VKGGNILIVRLAFEKTCCKGAEVDFDENAWAIRGVQFFGGCKGNLAGIASLLRDAPILDAADRLLGIPCGGKGTSCPDQLAQGLVRIAQKLHDEKG
jgi:uncharacterized protein (TIGR03905 family)